MSLRTWAHRLEASLEHFGSAVLREAKAVAGAVETAVGKTLDYFFGDEIRILTDPGAKKLDRVIAGAEIANTLAHPERKVIEKALIRAAEHAALKQLGSDTPAAVAAAEKMLDAAGVVRGFARGSLANVVLEVADGKKAENLVVAEGSSLVVAAATGQALPPAALATLAQLQTDSAAKGKSLVLFDPNLSTDQQTALLGQGIAVAKNARELASLTIASHLPGGVDRVNRATAAETPATPAAESVAVAQGTPHPEAIEYKAGQRWEGRITAVGGDGSFEIKCGRQFVKFNVEQAAELRVDPKDLRAGSYMDIVRPDPGQPPRAEIAADYRSLQQRLGDDRGPER